MKSSAPRLFCFGLGFSGLRLARRLLAEGFAVAGTCRDAATRDGLTRLGIEAHLFDRARPLADPAAALAGTTHLLSSVPPDADGDTVLDLCQGAIVGLGETLRWAGYLSTTGVYGDRGGATVVEGDALAPTSGRARRRAAAEAAWLALAGKGVPLHVFRLAGIYGPGRSILGDIRAGRARRVVRPGHIFSRIHVDDIVATLRASMAKPNPGAIYNVCDDAPEEPARVVAFACGLLGLAPPPEVPFAEAEKEMSAMQRTFWGDNKRIDNRRIKDELGVVLRYPGYAEGLRAILEEERGAGDAAPENPIRA